jgi:hypothetical protein
MPSFEIADCATSVQLTQAVQGTDRVQKGSLTLTVRNKTERARVGRITIESEGAVKPAWFAFDGAAPTNPREIERDFDAKSSTTFRVNIGVPSGGAPGPHVFRVRATAEDDPDNDFTVGPNVGFSVPASMAEPQRREKFPWWAIAVAGVMLLVVVGTVIWLLLGPVVPQLVGLSRTEAETILRNASFGFKTALVIVGNVGRSQDRVVLSDPAEGDRLQRGSDVRLFIGAPTNLFRCPDQQECVFAVNLPVEAQAAIKANMDKIEHLP